MPDDSRTQHRVALIAAAAALVASLIGGGAAYLATLRTGSDQSNQAEHEFLVTQRQAAYAKLVSDANTMLGYLPQLSSQVNTAYSNHQAVPSPAQAQSLLDTIQLDTQSVRLIGSDKAAGAALKLFLATVTYEKLSRTSPPVSYTTLSQQSRQVGSLMDDFMERARHDLGAGS